MQLSITEEKSSIRERLEDAYESILSHPFFNWRWSIFDVALIAAVAYTLHK